MPPPIAAPADKPYVGPVKLTVDLSDNVHRVASVHEEIPVEDGAKELVLLFHNGFLAITPRQAPYLRSAGSSRQLTASGCNGCAIG